MAEGLATGTLPPFIGIRIKSLTGDLAPRAIRTLELFLSSLLERSGGGMPPHFAITLPKITAPVQVDVLADVCDRLEEHHGLAPGMLRSYNFV